MYLRHTRHAITMPDSQRILSAPTSFAQVRFIGMLSGLSDTAFCVIIIAAVTAVAVVLRKCYKRYLACDIRDLCPCIARLFLKTGHDLFEAFPVVIKAHSVKELKNPSLLGGGVSCKFVFRHRIWQTKLCNSKGKFNMSSNIVIPQGCETCRIEILPGMKGKPIGVVELNVWKDMLHGNRDDDFFGKDRWLYLYDKGNRVGQVHVTFRRGQQEEMPPILEGMSTDNHALAALCENNVPENAKCPLRGEYKMLCIGKSLQGKLFRMGTGPRGKDFWFALVKMVPPEMDSDDEKVLLEKAEKKGLKGIEQKWFFCWYENQAEFKRNFRDPEGYIPVLAMTSVRRDTKNQARFNVNYKEKNKKKIMSLKPSQIEIETWIDGLSLFLHEAHHLKTHPEDAWVSRIDPTDQSKIVAHTEWKKMDAEQRKEQWRAYWREQNYTEAQIELWFQEQQDKGRLS